MSYKTSIPLKIRFLVDQLKISIKMPNPFAKKRTQQVSLKIVIVVRLTAKIVE